MLIEVDPDFETIQVKDEIKNDIDRIDTFPEDAEETQVKEIVNKDVVVSMALFGEAPERTLKEIAKEIKDELLSYPDISLPKEFRLQWRPPPSCSSRMPGHPLHLSRHFQPFSPEMPRRSGV